MGRVATPRYAQQTVGESIDIDKLRVPTHMSEAARDVWNEVVPDLIKRGLMGYSDVGIVAAYCDSYASYVEIVRQITKDGELIETDKGPKAHPLVNSRDRQLKHIHMFAKVFGLQPAARKLMNVTPPGEADTGSLDCD